MGNTNVQELRRIAGLISSAIEGCLSNDEVATEGTADLFRGGYIILENGGGYIDLKNITVIPKGA